MADTETIRQDETLERANAPGKPDRGKALALAAIDTALCNKVDQIFGIAVGDAEAARFSSRAGEIEDPIVGAVRRGMEAVRTANAIWSEFRKQINAEGGEDVSQRKPA